MPNDSKLRGACLCGAVRFEIELPLRFNAHCHCSMCRRAHGAAVVTWAGVPESAFRLSDGESSLRRYASSDAATRSFCGTCGSSLFFQSAKHPGEVHVTVANLIDPVTPAPQAHAHYNDRVDWLELADGLPRLGGESGLEPL